MDNTIADESLTHSVNGGLTQEEASKRLREYGPNEVPEKKRNPLLRFVDKLWGLTPWMLM